MMSRVRRGLRFFSALSSRKALKPSGRFCKPISSASNGATGEPSATSPPSATDSGTASSSMPVTCGASRRRRPSARSTRKAAMPPNSRMGIASRESPMLATPWGTSTTATAPTRIPPPSAMRKWRSSCSSQRERMCSKLARWPPIGMQAAAAMVSTRMVVISLMTARQQGRPDQRWTRPEAGCRSAQTASRPSKTKQSPRKCAPPTSSKYLRMPPSSW